MEPKIEPKTELLVFNKKEVTVIIVLLILVALFSFTLGLRLGKSLAGQSLGHSTAEEEAPLEGHASEATPHGETHGPDHSSAQLTDQEQQSSSHGESDHAGTHGENADKNQKVEEKAPDHAQSVEDHADAEFVAETTKEKVHAAKPVPMTLPKEKKGEALDSPRYTLQVGSHRTVAEAAEQVSGLKKSGLNDAFYLEAKLPGKGTWYRVGIGVFSTKEAAEQQVAKLKAAKKPMPPTVIVQKISE